MLKLSGEALMGDKDFGIDLDTINSITSQISVILKNGIKISIVVGGGNIFRGISASSEGMDRSSADYTGIGILIKLPSNIGFNPRSEFLIVLSTILVNVSSQT